MPSAPESFSVQQRVTLVIGGSGVLGSALARGFAAAGARVVVAGRRVDVARRVAEEIQAAGGQAFVVGCDALDRAALERAADEIAAHYGPVEVLINAAGGNLPQATTSSEVPFFDLETEAMDAVLAANYTAVVQSCQVFGRRMAAHGAGCIINIASMSALRPLTRVVAYGAAKAAVVNFTQWLAVNLAQEYGPRLRVNAIAPGFILTEQNRFLLTEAESGAWTPRGQAIVGHTPMGRLGAPEDLVGTALWLASPASAFVTGVVVPVDGGFAAYSGV